MQKLVCYILSFIIGVSLTLSGIIYVNANDDEENVDAIEYHEVEELVIEIEDLALSYTNRFIVKMKENDILSNTINKAFYVAKVDKVNKISEIEQDNKDEFQKLDLDISNDIGEISISEDARAMITETKIDLNSDNEILVYYIGNDETVVELPESVNPEVFSECVLSELENDIEYIQPDYKLELSDIDELTDISDNYSEISQSIEAEDIEYDDTSDTQGIDMEVIETPTGHVDNEVSDTVTTNAYEVEQEYIDALYDTELEATETPIPLADITSNTDTLNVLQDDIQTAWQITKGEGVKIAVIDGKVDVTHPDLVSHIINGFDVTTNSELIYDINLNEQYYHGTHVTGIIASTVPEAEIIPISVFNDGIAYTSDIIKAIEYAKEQGADIVNCSWGGTNNNQALKEAIENSGMLFVCAAGNNRQNVDEIPEYPACFDFENVISVASLNQDLGFSYYSNYGTSVDIAMYGRDVYSTVPGGEYNVMSGTSMATAYVTAGAAMSKSIDSNTNIKEMLLTTSFSLSNLQDKVYNGNKLSYSNLAYNIVNNDIIEVTPEDDFDVFGYERTDDENWDLFSSMKVVGIEAGGNNTAFIMSDGTLWMTGDNTYGQLGNGNYENSNVPVQVIGLKNIIQVSIGEDHCIALSSDGHAYLWGNNIYHAISSSELTKFAVPIIFQISGIGYIEAGSHTSFICTSTAKYALGKNDYGQLCLGTKETITEPTKIESQGGTYKSYGKHTIFSVGALVMCCGSDDHNIMGTSSSTTALEPVILDKGVYYDTGQNHVVILADSYVFVSGTNKWGQCGLGKDNTGDYTSLLNIREILNEDDLDLKSVKCGKEHTVILSTDGRVITWGYNVRGQIGDGTHNNRYEPYIVNNLSNIIQVAAGENHTVALDRSGKVWVWGDNSLGQYGNGNNLSSNSPISVNAIYNESSYITKSISVTTGNDYTVILTSENLNLSSDTKIAVYYDPTVLEIIDAVEYTYEKNLEVGNAANSDLYIDKNIEGEIIFQKNINSECYTGFLNSIKFKSKMSGNALITVTIL